MKFILPASILLVGLLAQHALSAAIPKDASCNKYRVQLTSDRFSQLDLDCKPFTGQMDSAFQPTYFSDSSMKLYQKSSNSNSLKWVTANSDCFSKNNPVVGGMDSEGEPVYVCRVDQDMIGFVSPKIGVCQIAHGNQVSMLVTYSNYQLLTNPNGVKLTWIPLKLWIEENFSYESLVDPEDLDSPRMWGTYRQGLAARVEVVDSPQHVLGALFRAHPTLLEWQIPNAKLESTEVLVAMPSTSQLASEEFIMNIKSSRNQQFQCRRSSEPFVKRRYEKAYETYGITQSNDGPVQWEMYKQKVERSVVWVQVNNNCLPNQNLVMGGRDSIGNPTYICRCVNCHGGHSIPGYVSPSTGVCHMTYGGKAYTHTSYQVMTNPHHVTLRWSPGFEGGAIPSEGAVVGGSETGVGTYYLGRTRVWDGSVVVGKVHPVASNFFYSHNGQENDVFFDGKYDVLVADD